MQSRRALVPDFLKLAKLSPRQKWRYDLSRKVKTVEKEGWDLTFTCHALDTVKCLNSLPLKLLRLKKKKLLRFLVTITSETFDNCLCVSEGKRERRQDI